MTEDKINKLIEIVRGGVYGERENAIAALERANVMDWQRRVDNLNKSIKNGTTEKKKPNFDESRYSSNPYARQSQHDVNMEELEDLLNSFMNGNFEDHFNSSRFGYGRGRSSGQSSQKQSNVVKKYKFPIENGGDITLMQVLIKKFVGSGHREPLTLDEDHMIIKCTENEVKKINLHFKSLKDDFNHKILRYATTLVDNTLG